MIDMMQYQTSNKKQESWPRLDFLFENGGVLQYTNFSITTREFLTFL